MRLKKGMAKFLADYFVDTFETKYVVEGILDGFDGTNLDELIGESREAMEMWFFLTYKMKDMEEAKESTNDWIKDLLENYPHLRVNIGD